MAAPALDPSVGNVMSRDFQFAAVDYMRAHLLGERAGWPATVVWAEAPVEGKPKPITNAWIYAFERSGDKAILVAEYRADESGALTFVPGNLRRRAEPGRTAPVPVKAACLPILRQGTRLEHFFVVMRGPLPRTAIADIENGVSLFFVRRDLSDGNTFLRGAGQTWFVRVADPLTTAEELSRRYHQALNEAMRFEVPIKGDSQAKEIEENARRYQLGKLMRDVLRFHQDDPFQVRGHLGGYGEPLLFELRKQEAERRNRQQAIRLWARAVVLFLESDVWAAVQRWYLQDMNGSYHRWLDSAGHAVSRLGESPEGRAYLKRVIEGDEPHSLFNQVIASLRAAEEEEEGRKKKETHAKEVFDEVFPAVRKSITTVFLVVAEFAPAMIALRLSRANERIALTIRKHLTRAEVALAWREPGRAFLAQFSIETTTLHLELNHEKALADLEKWIEEGKPHWPHEMKWASAAELLGHVMIAVEAVNLYNALWALQNMRELKVKPILEAIGATLDMLVALEEVLGPFVHKFLHRGAHAAGEQAGHLAGHGGAARVAGEAAHGLEEAEHVGAALAKNSGEKAGKRAALKKFLGKMGPPSVFKVLGVMSAAIDAGINFYEAGETWSEGETELSLAHGVAAAGALFVVFGSAGNALTYPAEMLFLTTVSAGFLAFGTAVFMLGMILVECFKRTPFQKMVRYSIFGADPNHRGEATWLEGEFSEWDSSVKGLDSQIDHLMALLCDYTVMGPGEDTQLIHIKAGCLPPKAEFQVDFALKYEDGRARRCQYRIDVETESARGEHGTPEPSSLTVFPHGRAATINLRAGKAHGFDDTKIVQSVCHVRMFHGEEPRGAVPTWGPVEYVIRDRWTSYASYELSACDAEKPKGLAHGGEHGEEHGQQGSHQRADERQEDHEAAGAEPAKADH